MQKQYPNLWLSLLAAEDHYRDKAIAAHGKEQLHYSVMMANIVAVSSWISDHVTKPVVCGI